MKIRALKKRFHSRFYVDVPRREIWAGNFQMLRYGQDQTRLPGLPHYNSSDLPRTRIWQHPIEKVTPNGQ